MFNFLAKWFSDTLLQIVNLQMDPLKEDVFSKLQNGQRPMLQK